MKDDKLYLIHISECISKIESYVKNGKDEFIKSTLHQDATIRNFEIIGEAVKQVSEGIKKAHAEVPWREVAGLRDILIHDYMGVDLDEVWNIVDKKLSEFKKDIEKILKELPK